MTEPGLWNVYVTSYYFTFTTMTTVGYGDIHAFNSLERVINILVQVRTST